MMNMNASRSHVVSLILSSRMSSMVGIRSGARCWSTRRSADPGAQSWHLRQSFQPVGDELFTS